MPRKKRRPSYSGELNKPIVVPILQRILGSEWANSDQGRAEKEAWIRTAQAEKLPLLLTHFGIPATSKVVWFRLAYELACEHVPGMRVVETPPQKGRPRKSPPLCELRAAVHLIQAEHSFKHKRRPPTVSRAIQILQEREPKKWGRFEFRKLSHWYYEAMKEYPRGQGPLEILCEGFGLNSMNESHRK